uniref:RNase H type-1 domain-containing protein n=1 Tax=Setaria viridis TaxID=4556 RepID=A0A4U6W130_SETVI|nr:LOW QUALITY PROTEIN: hypothetical protein SEVIR_2G417600v2 [Setaria viridis]
MATRSTCSICSMSDSWKHSLIECNMVKCVWALEREEITQLTSETQETESRGWLAAIISSLKHEDLMRMVVTLWAIWYAPGLEMIKTAASVRRTQGVPPRWIPPPPSLVKINVDAATSKNSSKAVAAAIARDVVENFLGASVLVIHGLLDAEIVEDIACREGLALSSDLMVQHFMLTSDNVNVIKGIKEKEIVAHGHIIMEIKATAVQFGTADFIHFRSNVDAHTILLAAANTFANARSPAPPIECLPLEQLSYKFLSSLLLEWAGRAACR